MKPIAIVFWLICFASRVVAQYAPTPVSLYKLQSLRGELELNGKYQDQEKWYPGAYDHQKSSQYSGGIQVRTKSYFWHPNFLAVDVNGGYSPVRQSEKYLIMPDHAENQSIKKLDISAIFFQHKPLNLSLFANFNQNYSNRENLSNIQSDFKNTGGTFSCFTGPLPFSVNFRKSDWKQREILTNRNFTNQQQTLNSVINKSFGKTDKHILTFTHEEFARQDDQALFIHSKSDNLTLSNAYSDDEKTGLTLNSILSATRQTGHDSHNRGFITENLNWTLPFHFRTGGAYDLYYFEKEQNKLVQQNFRLFLSHKLYQSLQTEVTGEAGNTHHTLYQEENKKTGFSIHYEKKIPGGRFMFGFGKSIHWQNKESDPVPVQVVNEAIHLTDGQIELLEKPFPDIPSIVIKDISGTILYQEFLDYVVVSHPPYVEIQRVPGGQIPNNTTVYADYFATQPGSYNFILSNRFFNVSLLLFQNIWEIYFRDINQDYSDFNGPEAMVLNYFHQQVIGSTLNFKFLQVGSEYDDYASNVIPYRMLRHFIVFQKDLGKRMNLSLSGNYRDYTMPEEKIRQQFSDISGCITFIPGSNTRIRAELGYRNQKGPQINLDYLTAVTGFYMGYRLFSLSLNVGFYKRNYLGEKIIFNSASIVLTRKF